MPLPMLADFAIRLACGLAAALAATPWRVVPPRFFRAQCQVILGLGVLAALVISGSSSGPVAFGLAIAVAAMAFASSIAWGLGLPRLGMPVALAIAAASAVLLAVTADPGRGDLASPVLGLNALSRLASAFLLGSTLTAMLLGHHYLTAPSMSIVPLERLVRLMAAGLVVRTVLSALMLGWAWSRAGTGLPGGPTIPAAFVAMRWGMGIFGVGVATVLTWKTVRIRSTQSATGILYIAMTLLLFGELSSLVLARESHMTI